MIIENRRREKQVEETVKVARISKDDIKDMVIEYLNEAFGIKEIQRSKIFFNMSWKYVSDEWGMNRSLVTIFEGVTVELPEGGEIDDSI